MKALVIDDQPHYLPIGDLREFGPEGVTYTVIDHPDKLEGVDYSEFDLVILDHRMPVKLGDEVAHDIRNAGHTMPIFRISSFREGDYPEGCYYVERKALGLSRFEYLLMFTRGEIDEDTMWTKINTWGW